MKSFRFFIFFLVTLCLTLRDLEGELEHDLLTLIISDVRALRGTVEATPKKGLNRYESVVKDTWKCHFRDQTEKFVLDEHYHDYRRPFVSSRYGSVV